MTRIRIMCDRTDGTTIKLGDFWEPISTLKAFLQFHPKWKAERKHRKARI